MIEYVSIANEGHVLRTRDDNIVKCRRHEPQTIDGVRFTHDRFLHAKEREYLAALGRHSAAAGLVSGKVKAIDNNDPLHAKLTQVHRRCQAGWASTNDADLGTD